MQNNNLFEPLDVDFYPGPPTYLYPSDTSGASDDQMAQDYNRMSISNDNFGSIPDDEGMGASYDMSPSGGRQEIPPSCYQGPNPTPIPPVPAPKTTGPYGLPITGPYARVNTGTGPYGLATQEPNPNSGQGQQTGPYGIPPATGFGPYGLPAQSLNPNIGPKMRNPYESEGF